MGKEPPRYYEMDNMRNANKLASQQYRSIPSAPTLEVTINQNAAPSLPSTNNYSNNYNHNHQEYPDHPWIIDRFPRRENRGMFRLALVESLLAVVILAGGIWCARDTADYCPYHSAIWTSSFYLLNAIVGAAAAKLAGINLYLAHLVLSLLAVMMCVVSAILSARNWLLVGTYHHPSIERDEAFCLLGEHDATRISYIFRHMDQYDFRQCLFQLKIGVAVNSLQFVIAGIESFLNLLSAILCCKRTCTRCTPS